MYMTSTCTSICKSKYIYMYAYTRQSTCTFTCTYNDTCTSTCVSIYMYIYMYIHMHLTSSCTLHLHNTYTCTVEFITITNGTALPCPFRVLSVQWICHKTGGVLHCPAIFHLEKIYRNFIISSLQVRINIGIWRTQSSALPKSLVINALLRVAWT